MVGIRSSAMSPFVIPELEVLRAGQSRSATPDAGLVYLVDRMKDIISRGGENAYCAEVEAPWPGTGVYEAAVLGVPDEMMRRVAAVIVPVPGTALDMAVVVDYLAAPIADFKIPQYVAVSTAPRRAIPAASCSSASSARAPAGPPPALAGRGYPARPPAG
jgi:acyl-CoA synthetase (AMP-forming)/AMP-acid ligase II